MTLGQSSELLHNKRIWVQHRILLNSRILNLFFFFFPEQNWESYGFYKYFTRCQICRASRADWSRLFPKKKFMCKISHQSASICVAVFYRAMIMPCRCRADWPNLHGICSAFELPSSHAMACVGSCSLTNNADASTLSHSVRYSRRRFERRWVIYSRITIPDERI